MDAFLEMLEVKAPPRKPVKPFQPDYTQELDEMELPKPHARPDFADDIDRIVADMVAAGDVYLDLDRDVYTCRKRCWRMI